MLDQLAWTVARKRDVRDPAAVLNGPASSSTAGSSAGISAGSTTGSTAGSSPSSTVLEVATSTDTLALWYSTPFSHVIGYRGWRDHVAKPLASLIRCGSVVPFSTWYEGSYSVRVSLDPTDVTDREKTYTEWTNEPYLLVADGGPTYLSGLEAVGNPAASAFELTLAPGQYAVRASLIAWDEEPGSHNEDGTRAPHALPALLVSISPIEEGDAYRTSLHTYGPCSCSA